MNTANILIVEDEHLVASDIEQHLTDLGYNVTGIAHSAASTYEYLGMVKPDLALMDIHLKGTVDGITAAKQLRDIYHVPVVFLTAHADPATLKRAIAAESYGYIIKPFSSQTLAATVAMALQRSRVENEAADIARKHQLTLSSIGDAVIATDRSSRVSFINPIAEQLTGWSAAEAIGLPLIDVFNVVNENQPGGIIEMMGKVFAKKKPIDNEDGMSLIRRDGYTVPVEINFAPICDESQKIIGTVSVFRQRSQWLQAILPG